MKKTSRIGGIVSVALLAGCGVLGSGDPEPRAEEPAVTVSPRQAAPGAQVTLRARGFPGRNTVQIGFGPPQSEYEVLGQAQTDAAGRLNATVTVPTWADSGRDYVWVVADRDNEPRVVSDRFRVE